MTKSKDEKSINTNTLKMVLRFEKSEELFSYNNDQIIDLFKQTFLQLHESSDIFPFDFARLSLASTNQKYGIICGVDYLFFDLFIDHFQKKDTLNMYTKNTNIYKEVDLVSEIDLLCSKVNLLLSGKLIVTNIVNTGVLATPNINKYAYYKADLSEFELPNNFYENLILIMTRDTNFFGENISVTEITQKKIGNSHKEVTTIYHLIELIQHIYYDKNNNILYFIADGNTPAYVLLAGLIYGRCVYSHNSHKSDQSSIKINRLDYVDSQQKITHNNRHYDNVLGDYIQKY